MLRSGNNIIFLSKQFEFQHRLLAFRHQKDEPEFDRGEEEEPHPPLHLFLTFLGLGLSSVETLLSWPFSILTFFPFFALLHKWPCAKTVDEDGQSEKAKGAGLCRSCTPPIIARLVPPSFQVVWICLGRPSSYPIISLKTAKIYSIFFESSTTAKHLWGGEYVMKEKKKERIQLKEQRRPMDGLWRRRKKKRKRSHYSWSFEIELLCPGKNNVWIERESVVILRMKYTLGSSH